MGTYQSKYTGQEIDNGINPVGNIISFMGTIAPNGYLICDGAEVNIADYPNLATHFETQFGSKNYFGGDGATTFAVPDLRNEFLRGYGELSGEIGKHQDATTVPVIGMYSTSNLGVMGTQNPDWSTWQSESVDNLDEAKQMSTVYYKISATKQSGSSTAVNGTVRPTNVAVLYCIKY